MKVLMYKLMGSWGRFKHPTQQNTLKRVYQKAKLKIKSRDMLLLKGHPDFRFESSNSIKLTITQLL